MARGKDLRASRRQRISFHPPVPQRLSVCDPALSGKAERPLQRVPVKTGSVTELVAILGKKSPLGDQRRAEKGDAGAINRSEAYRRRDCVVRCDWLALFTVRCLTPRRRRCQKRELQLVKAVAWYDNKYGFVTQLVRTLDKVCGAVILCLYSRANMSSEASPLLWERVR